MFDILDIFGRIFSASTFYIAHNIVFVAFNIARDGLNYAHIEQSDL